MTGDWQPEMEEGGGGGGHPLLSFKLNLERQTNQTRTNYMLHSSGAVTFECRYFCRVDFPGVSLWLMGSN